LYNKRGRRLKRKSSIIQIEGVGAVPTSRSTAEEELRETRWTSSSKMVGRSHPSAQRFLMNKQEHISKLWGKKSVSEVILIMYNLIENTTWDTTEKKKSYAVLKGIIAYTDRGADLLTHHRDYLHNEWSLAWLDQKNNLVKEEIKDWLLE